MSDTFICIVKSGTMNIHGIYLDSNTHTHRYKCVAIFSRTKSLKQSITILRSDYNTCYHGNNMKLYHSSGSVTSLWNTVWLSVIPSNSWGHTQRHRRSNTEHYKNNNFIIHSQHSTGKGRINLSASVAGVPYTIILIHFVGLNSMYSINMINNIITLWIITFVNTLIRVYCT